MIHTVAETDKHKSWAFLRTNVREICTNTDNATRFSKCFYWDREVFQDKDFNCITIHLLLLLNKCIVIT